MKNTYQIDATHSNVQFSVRHLMISHVRGSFSGVKGTVVHDTEKPLATTIEAEIDADTIWTKDAKRDAHLKSADFFDVEKYPAIVFKSTSVTGGSASNYVIVGDLTLHGVTKPVTLNVEEVSEETKDPWSATRIGVTAKGKLRRDEFGLVWNAALEAGGVVVGEEVKIELDMQLVKS